MNDRQAGGYMGRRNLNAAHKLELQFANKDELLKAGRERKVEEGKATGRGNKKVLSEIDNTFNAPAHNTRDTIAAAAEIKRVCQILTHPLLSPRTRARSVT